MRGTRRQTSMICQLQMIEFPRCVNFIVDYLKTMPLKVPVPYKKGILQLFLWFELILDHFWKEYVAFLK